MKEFMKEALKDLKSVKSFLFGTLLLAILSLVPGLIDGGEGDLSQLGLLVCFALIAVFIVVYAMYWKCPHCGKHLDKLVLTQKCKRCGKRIDK